MNLTEHLSVPVSLKGVSSSNLMITVHTASGVGGKVFIKAYENRVSEFPESWKLDLADPPKNYRVGKINFKYVTMPFKIASYAMLGLILMLGVANTLNVAQVRIVATGSMIPAIEPGDMVIGLNSQFIEAAVDDVVIYQARRFDNEEVAKFAHRIIGGDSISGFVLKGDNNPEPDVQRVSPEDIESVIIFQVPNVGYILNPQIIIYALMALVAMFIAWEFLKSDN